MSRNNLRSNTRNSINSTQDQIINISEYEPTQKGFTFNYSENFNHITGLTTDNFVNWKTNILYLLSINNLDDYISHEKVKKIRRRDITESIEKYTIDKFDDSLVYEIGTSEKDIKNDILVKWIITNNLGENTKKILESQSKTAFQLWELLNKSFTIGPEQRKMVLKDKINKLKYNLEDDVHIFLAFLQNLLDELERIDSDINDNIKVGILNRALPENIRFINVFQYNNNWTKCCDYVKRIIPNIVCSNIRETTLIEQNPKNIFSLENRRKIYKPKKIKYKNRGNGKCCLCGKFGHYRKDCLKNKFNKNKRNNKQHKRKSNTKKFNKEKSREGHAYLLNDKKDYNKNYQENFSRDYNSDNCFELNNLEINKPTKIDIRSNNNNITQWILDSGASINVTNNINILSNIRKEKIKISLANGKETYVNYIVHW